MMMHKIFWLTSNVRFEDKLAYSSEMRLETELCSRRPEHAARARWTRPLKVISPIQPMTDFEWTVYGDIIVNSEIAESFRNAKFSGVQFSPSEFYTSTETPFGRSSFELRVTGWGGRAPVESGIREIERCPYCKNTVFSGYTHPERLFNIDGWDGSDMFLIWPLPRYIMVTGRVRDFISDAKYTGVRFRKLTELPPVVAGTLTPGNLHNWFDDDRLAVIENS
jgi:hypothetical protein